MFALTVDQVDSRHGSDLVAAVEADRDRWRDAGAVLGPDRTAGDEFQLLLPSAEAALRASLDLLRRGTWTVGMGVGGVALPLPATTREVAGPVMTAARAAVEDAKRTPHRFTVVSDADPRLAADATALVRLLLECLGRRTPEGWEVADLLATGLTQGAAAERLGITAQAVSARARAAGVRTERDALPALVRALASLEAS